MTLWDRIGSALSTAVAKCDDGDTDRMISLCLDHVRADAGAAGRHIGLSALLYAAGEKTLAWRQGWSRYIASHSYALLAHARLRWEKVKVQRNDERALARGGKLSSGEIVEKAVK